MTNNVNVKLTHLPTGIVVSVNQETSPHRAKNKADKILRARLWADKNLIKRVKIYNGDHD